LTFKPNPRFQPSSHEARVLNALAGSLWVNAREQRIAAIQGHLVHEVRFLGGFGGHLDQGGVFRVRTAEVAPGHWQIAALKVHMKGKALFFKTISVQQDESRTNFREVPNNWSLAQAAEMLSNPKASGPG
jgi:hypothetical protein